MQQPMRVGVRDPTPGVEWTDHVRHVVTTAPIWIGLFRNARQRWPEAGSPDAGSDAGLPLAAQPRRMGLEERQLHDRVGSTSRSAWRDAQGLSTRRAQVGCSSALSSWSSAVPFGLYSSGTWSSSSFLMVTSSSLAPAATECRIPL